MHVNHNQFVSVDSPVSITCIIRVSQLQLAFSDSDSVLVHKERGITIRMPQCRAEIVRSFQRSKVFRMRQDHKCIIGEEVR
jgi:hypothetical protein